LEEPESLQLEWDWLLLSWKLLISLNLPGGSWSRRFKRSCVSDRLRVRP
jgi:hypothetical protein